MLMVLVKRVILYFERPLEKIKNRCGLANHLENTGPCTGAIHKQLR